LYRVIAETTGRSGYLSHNQLTTSVTFRQERCQVSYVLDHFYGTINGEINLEAQQTCFYEAFNQAILLQLLATDCDLNNQSPCCFGNDPVQRCSLD
jgi:hypothetical protein